ncbi:ABC transporter ATP-binding protein [Rhodococcus koreensis]|uniref:Iron complex transport system ATP-binding protein n=1 Tax=Rhodococcus koreensis TaxID=99653 RepID=A0A1H4TA98_9NOCA|nr:ATP-binding cassette domain-containing protein [Rhodococcus koreensis]SEC53228.1 iron complex transport system ATP-binding protein [Rhodococcus koreensis]
MTLHANGVTWNRGGALVVDGVTVTPAQGATVGLLGPNGSGKSSLLRLLNGVVRPTSGVVTLDGNDLTTVRRKDIARAVAVVSQHADTDVDISVRDVVRLGRIPHRGTFGGNPAADEAAVAAALEHTGLAAKADRLWHRLSGGEKQRVQIARALAQQPRELLLDEPTNHLDIHHQLELLSLVTRLPVTSVIALHDLNLAAMFCDTVIVLKEGRVVAGGTPADVLTSDLIAQMYNVRAEVLVDEPKGRLSILFEPGPVPVPVH